VIISIPKLVVGLALALVVGCGSEADMMGMAGEPQVDGGAGAGTGGAVGTQGTGGTAGMTDAGATKTDVLVAATGGAGGSAPGTGGTAGGAGGVGGSVPAATGGAPGTGGSGMGGAGGAPALMYCPQYPEFSRSKPGYLNKDLTWTSRYKDGYACAICSQGKTAPKQVVGCLVKYSVELDGPDPLLCVQSQAECCFKQPNSACEHDSDCCSPLKCMDNGAGKVKSCR
jgi:hypothetical protein